MNLRTLLRRLTRRHSHFYPWSEVKAARFGGPPPRCRFCGKAAKR